MFEFLKWLLSDELRVIGFIIIIALMGEVVVRIILAFKGKITRSFVDKFLND